MSDLNYSIDKNGINIPTQNEIIDYYKNNYKNIYGNDINLNQNTPDGQLINIKAQNQNDVNEIALAIYNSFDPDLAEGVCLDRVVAFHGIKRNSGSFTQVVITINANDTVNLQGLDSSYSDINGTGFTVSDNNGNQFILITSTITQIGDNNLLFRAQNIGEIIPSVNTLTNILTPQIGILSANNNSTPIVIGTNEESDYDLRKRFYQTDSIKGIGELDNIISNIYSLDSVVSVFAQQNREKTTDIYGIPGNCIWIIVDGGNDNEIADVIYSIISAGCNTKGNIETIFNNEFGGIDYIRFDRPTIENLYINFTVEAKNSSAVIDTDYLKNTLINQLTFKINDTVSANDISNILRQTNNNLVYYNIGLSNDGITYDKFINNTNINYIFSLSINNINITVN